MKKAIILFNLGGPDKLESVQPFLFNLFNDKAIIALPQPFRWLLAKLISSARFKKAADIYKRIGNKSPLVEETQAQAAVLEKQLNASDTHQYKVFVSMRYWHPLAEEVVKQVLEFNPDEIVLLPLYPQYSSTTTASSFKDWQENAARFGLNATTRKICCYYDDALFCKAYAELIMPSYEDAQKQGEPIVLFSAHGIPLNRVEKGDPYEWQVKQSVIAVKEILAIPNLDYEICYQSKVGPLKWLEPATDVLIKKYASQRRPIVLVPISFVSEHSETLVELDIQYKDLAIEFGSPGYYRVPTVRTHKTFIDALRNLCIKAPDSQCDCSLKACKAENNKVKIT